MFEYSEFGKSLICNSTNPFLVKAMLRLTGSVGIEVRSNDYWKNLRYLENIPDLSIYGLGRGLSLDAFDGIESQTDIKSLSLGLNSTAKIDWSVFKKMEKIFCEGGFVRPSLWELPMLSDLFISSCSEKNWDNISLVKNLKKIKIVRGGMDSFLGLSSPSLHCIEVHHNRKFYSLRGNCDFDSVEELRITFCKQLNSLSGIEGFKNLRKLSIENCGHVDSLSPILALGSLECLHMSGTQILDGSVKKILALENIREIFFKDSKDYDIGLLECLKQLGVPREKWPLMYQNPGKWKKLTGI